MARRVKYTPRAVLLAAIPVILLMGFVMGWLLRGYLESGTTVSDTVAHDAASLPMGFVVSEMAGVDLSGLDDERRLLAFAMLNRVPCFKSRGGVSVARCRRDAPSCVTSQRMADFILDGVRRGLSREDILVAVYNKALSEDHVPSRVDDSKTDLYLKELPTLGPKGAPVTVTVVYDYTGEISRKAITSINELRAIYPDKVRVVFWPLPRTRVRPGAERVARLALAAQQLGGFEIFHNFLLEKRGSVDPTGLEQFAKRSGLDTIIDAADSDKIGKRLETLMSATDALKVEFPPVIYVQGRRIRGGVPGACFLMDVVQEALVAVVRAEYKNLEERIAP